MVEVPRPIRAKPSSATGANGASATDAMPRRAMLSIVRARGTGPNLTDSRSPSRRPLTMVTWNCGQGHPLQPALDDETVPHVNGRPVSGGSFQNEGSQPGSDQSENH